MQIHADADPSAHRFSEKSYRRYEDIILAALNAYPNGIEFKPVGISLATAEARLRDALRSVIVNRWKTKVNIDQLIANDPFMVVRCRGASIYIGHSAPEMVEVYYDSMPGNPSPQLSAATSKGTKTLENPSSEELASVMILANRGFFADQPIILTNLAEGLSSYIHSSNYLSRFPNIIVDYQENNDTFILL